jgi:hypothetical protein
MLISTNLKALETDQFMMWNRNLEDSADQVNLYLSDSARTAIEKLNNSPKKYTCSQVHQEIIRWQQRDGLILAVESWVYGTDLLEKYPVPPEGLDDERKLIGAVVDQTIYRKGFIFRLKIFGVNINYNGVYMGIDKLAHLLETGYEYYEKYHAAIAKGKSHEDAVIAAIKKGIFQERTYYGYLVSGIFSFADLEANYQGLYLNNQFCHGDNRFLEQDEQGKWFLKNDIDLRPYVNPYMDETFYPNSYTRKRARSIKPFVKQYCELKDHPEVVQRMQTYQSRAVPSFSVKYLQDKVAKGKIKNPANFGIERWCK